MQIYIVILPIIWSISKNKNLETDAEYEFEIPFYLQFSIQLLSARRWNFKWASDNRNLLEIVWYFCERSEFWYWLTIAFNIYERWNMPIFQLLAIFLLMKDIIELLLEMTLKFLKKLIFSNSNRPGLCRKIWWRAKSILK
jgi:hypothetical protein